MTVAHDFLTASEAAKRLGVSIKTLRLYEENGLLSPARSDAGWRRYGPKDMALASEILVLRKLGLSLAKVRDVLSGDLAGLDEVLARHEEELAERITELYDAMAAARELRADLPRQGRAGLRNIAQMATPVAPVAASVALPWPWGGEIFDIKTPGRLTFITGPLASGKTQLARLLAETLSNASFLGVERLDDGGAAALAQLGVCAVLKARVDQAAGWLVEEGAEINDALIVLLARLEDKAPTILIVDLIEHGLSSESQRALMAYLRRREEAARPLFLMTRSSVILDLEELAPDENVILCPPNHSPPIYVSHFKGATGYESVRLCLASPEVRRRTQDVVAVRRA